MVSRDQLVITCLVWAILELITIVIFENSEIFKFSKNALGKFIPNCPTKHVITSTNYILLERKESPGGKGSIKVKELYCSENAHFSILSMQFENFFS